MSTEFVKQTMRENLTRVLVPHVSDGLWSIYDSAKQACLRNEQPEKTIQTFQNLLTRIPQWNEETLDKEVDRIRIASKCDYLEDLLLGVFVSYIRAFASLQQTEASRVNIEFDRPSLTKFIHNLYILAARKSWSQAYLFKTIGVSSGQQARNRRDIDTMLEGAMNEVIDSFIPWKKISQAYFQAQTTAPAAPALSFGDNEVHEFETDNEEEEEEEAPKITLGEDVELDVEDDDDNKSVDTDTELEQKMEKEAVSLDL